MLYFFPFFIFHKDILANINENDLSLIIKLNPQSLLDIFTHAKSLINPYYVLSKIFNIADSYMYQAFILYLNKSISYNNETSHFDINLIINGFVFNNDYANNLKFKNLLMYYISSKKILPFKIKYQKYISSFDIQ